MRSSAKGWLRAAAFMASAIGIACTAAEAGEMLVIPYACRVVDGEPVLSPSDDRGYRIIGKREEREFSACSPANPDMCRRWKVYRFDVDCGGRRVPWASLSAAADAHRGGRSWIERGRLHLEMPPRWRMDPDDPCARHYRTGWRDGPVSRFCDEPREAAPSDVVMPEGFAPMLDLDGIFVADSAPAATNAPVATLARAEQPVPKPLRAEAQATKSAAERPVKAPAPEPATPVAAREAPPVPAPAPAVPAKRESAPPSAAAAPTIAAADTPIAPTIINQPSTPPAQPQPERTAITPPETAPILASLKKSPVSVALKDTIEEAEPQTASATKADRTAPSVEVAIPTDLARFLSPALVGVGGVTMLGLLALVFAARRTREQPDFALAHDIATVSFDSRSGGRDLVRSGRWLDVAAGANGSPPSPAPSGPPSPSDWSSAIPQTRDEALQVLGMGVAPDGSEVAIKKIVDGLRLSWHPDYATTPHDRELRELRMKQINAAWDIIVGKRAG